MKLTDRITALEKGPEGEGRLLIVHADSETNEAAEAADRAEFRYTGQYQHQIVIHGGLPECGRALLTTRDARHCTTASALSDLNLENNHVQH